MDTLWNIIRFLPLMCFVAVLLMVNWCIDYLRRLPPHKQRLMRGWRQLADGAFVVSLFMALVVALVTLSE